MTGTRQQIAPKVMKLLVKAGGEPVSLDDLVSETGIEAPRVQQAIWRMIRDGQELTVVVPGQMWRYTGRTRGGGRSRGEVAARKPPAPTAVPEPGNRLFEEVVRVTDDVSVLRDNNGVAYTATLKRI